MDTKTIIELSKIEDEILDIIQNADEFTTSDLQGVIQAQVLKVYRMGKNAEKEDE